MKDKTYTKLLMRLSKVHEKYLALLTKAEDEFKERYGNFPSDIDYDSWIDVYHVGNGGFLSIEEMEKDKDSGYLKVTEEIQ